MAIDESRESVRLFYHPFWIRFCSSAKLMNNALRHLSIARLGRSGPVSAQKEAVYQMMLSLWVQVGFPVFPEPQVDAEDEDEADQMLSLFNRMDVL